MTCVKNKSSICCQNRGMKTVCLCVFQWSVYYRYGCAHMECHTSVPGRRWVRSRRKPTAIRNREKNWWISWVQESNEETRKWLAEPVPRLAWHLGGWPDIIIPMSNLSLFMYLNYICFCHYVTPYVDTFNICIQHIQCIRKVFRPLDFYNILLHYSLILKWIK